MVLEDKKKMAFVTDRGLYCYRMMPFGLKNVGATYQWLVDKIFKNQLSHNMEAYVDNMFVKSQAAPDHVADLRKTFDTFRQF